MTLYKHIIIHNKSYSNLLLNDYNVLQQYN